MDFILGQKTIIPVEVKYNSAGRYDDYGNILYFMNKYKIKKGFVFSKNYNKTIVELRTLHTKDLKPGEKSVLKKESITKERFKEIEFREIDARGTYRPLFLPVEWENIEKIKEDEEIVYKFTFSLQRAAYATIVMREFMKTEATAYV